MKKGKKHGKKKMETMADEMKEIHAPMKGAKSKGKKRGT